MHALYSTDPLLCRENLNALGEIQQELHTHAGNERDRIFGRKVHVRAVIEVSNHCRQNCHYCGMRRDNKALERSRLSLETLRKVLRECVPASVTDINFQAGEDPVVVREIVIPLIEEIRRETPYGVSVCLGTLDKKVYDELKQAGADYYILKIELGQGDLYKQLEAPGSLDKRIEALVYLNRNGWRVSSGFIMGLPGTTVEDAAETLQTLSSLPLAGCSVSPFIPGSQTPLAEQQVADINQTLNAVALMRLANPDRVIPAVSAMNMLDERGYVRALRCGANLTTINLTPPELRDQYLLYHRDRVIMGEQRVLRAIELADCQASTTSLKSHFEMTPVI